MDRLHQYLLDDLGRGDVTSAALFGKEEGLAEIIAQEPMLLAGVAEATTLFLANGCSVDVRCTDGEKAVADQVVLAISGPLQAIFAAERTALNIMMRMSGIASMVSEVSERTGKRIAATRKTTPGFGALEKKAVIIGGGDPHRMGMDDMLLIKTNHIAAIGGIEEALERAHRNASFSKKIEVEVTNAKDAHFVADKCDIVMLDNFSPEEGNALYHELKDSHPRLIVERSGGITPENVDQYEGDILSMGSITHSAQSRDLHLVLVSH